jgi:hypothetical protein
VAASDTATVMPFPPKTRAKDVTVPLRVRRHRQKRKAQPTVTAPNMALDHPGAEKPNEVKADVTISADPSNAPDMAAYIAAIALACASAWFNIPGMAVLAGAHLIIF